MKKQITLFIISLMISFIAYSQETYTIGKTEYYYDQYYSTTGKPLVKRNESNKKEFLQSLGYNKIPTGFEIDHIIPLSEGGTDEPSNMQLLAIEQHKIKTAQGNSTRSNSTLSTTKTYTKTTTNNSLDNNYETTSTSTYLRTNTNGRLIYKGSRGGEYYLNDSGKKVYLKTNSSSAKITKNSYSSPGKSSSRTIHTGPRGGKYYINSKGNKTYVKKKN